MSESNFYVAQDGEQLGRYSPQDLARWLLDGTFNGTEVVWRDGMKDWEPIRSVALVIPPRRTAESDTENEDDPNEDWKYFLETFADDLRELQDDDGIEGTSIVRRLNAEEKKSIKARAKLLKSQIGNFTVRDIVFEHFPEFLTEFGANERASARREKAETQAKRAGTIALALATMLSRQSGERRATKKQTDYLRDLGVEDEKLLSSLGIKQAAHLIGTILGTTRERWEGEDFKASTTPVSSKPAAQGCLVLFLALFAAVSWAYLRCKS